MAIGDKYDGGIGQAVHLMQFYMQQVYEAAGLRWDSDNDAEVQSMVECIVNAAKIAALEAQIIAVPVEAITAIVSDLPVDNWNRKPIAAVKKWLAGGAA